MINFLLVIVHGYIGNSIYCEVTVSHGNEKRSFFHDFQKNKMSPNI